MIWRWFWREWRSPSLLIVWLALTLAVACVLALGTIGDRMEKGLSQQSRDFLAGDRVLRASRPVDEAWLQRAQRQGLTLSRQISFMTMTFAGDTPQLARVKPPTSAIRYTASCRLVRPGCGRSREPCWSPRACWRCWGLRSAICWTSAIPRCGLTAS